MSDCYNNDWLFNSSIQWTLTSNSSSFSQIMLVTDNGWIINYYPNSVDGSGGLLAIAVRPVIFLKSNVKIIVGDGSISNPYSLQS